jgi:hypothetical protein
MSSAKKRTAIAATARTDGKPVVREPRPVEGAVDHGALIRGAMKQFAKTRARLAK